MKIIKIVEWIKILINLYIILTLFFLIGIHLWLIFKTDGLILSAILLNFLNTICCSLYYLKNFKGSTLGLDKITDLLTKVERL